VSFRANSCSGLSARDMLGCRRAAIVRCIFGGTNCYGDAFVGLSDGRPGAFGARRVPFLRCQPPGS
jgi:hypothetical protein